MASVTLAGFEKTVIHEDDQLYEIIDGQRVKKPVGTAEVYLANLFAIAINQHALPRKLGVAIVEPLLDLGKGIRQRRRPDLIFISQQRFPFRGKIAAGEAWAIVPELAVEVVSPSNTAFEIQEKIQEYFEAGVLLVWIVYPKQGQVHVHDGSNLIRRVDRHGELDGGEVLPGLRIPMADLFNDEDETPPAPG